MTLDEGKGLAVDEIIWTRLTIEFIEQWFRIEQILLGRRACHVNADDPACFRCKVRRREPLERLAGHRWVIGDQ